MSKREPASITNVQGVFVCNQLISDIDSCLQLAQSDYGIDVRKQLSGMRDRLMIEETFFSEKMHGAVNGWNRGIQGWVSRMGDMGETVQ